MATKNHRISSYFPEDLYAEFEQWRDSEELGDSNAIVQIVQTVLDVVPETPEIQMLEQLEEQLTNMEKLIEILKSKEMKRCNCS